MLKGKGLGLRTPHYHHVLTHLPKDVDWFEIISENFLYSEGRPLQVLEKVRSHYPIACHGVGLGLGNAEPSNLDYLKRLKKLVDRFQPEIVSDHLCWTTFQNHNSHDLLPVAFTQKQLDLVARKIDHAQNFLQRKILIENPSAYVNFACSEMSEVEFIRELCQRTSCSVLLDLNNLYVNHNNLGMDLSSYFEQLPRHAVQQFHVAGHTRRNELCIDTHDHPVCEDVLKIVATARMIWPEVPLLLERDDHIPEWSELVSELSHIYSISGSMQIESFSTKPHLPSQTQIVDHAYQTFFEMMTQRHHVEKEDPRLTALERNLPVKALTGMNVYNNAYFLRQRDVLRDIYPLVYQFLGAKNFDHFAFDYLVDYPSDEVSISRIGLHLPEFIENQKEDENFGFLSVLSNLAQFELKKWELSEKRGEENSFDSEHLKKLTPDDWNIARFALNQPSTLIKFEADLPSIIRDLEKDALQENLQLYGRESFALMHMTDNQVWWRFCQEDEFNFLTHIQEQKLLADFFVDKNESTSQKLFQLLWELASEKKLTLLDRMA